MRAVEQVAVAGCAHARIAVSDMVKAATTAQRQARGMCAPLYDPSLLSFSMTLLSFLGWGKQLNERVSSDEGKGVAQDLSRFSTAGNKLQVDNKHKRLHFTCFHHQPIYIVNTGGLRIKPAAAHPLADSF